MNGNIISKIKDALGEGKLDRAFDLFDSIPDKDIQDHKNSIILLKSRYSSVKRNLLIGISSRDSHNLEINKITHSLLSIADDIKISDSGDDPDQKDVSIDRIPLSKRTILFLASNPRDTGRLRLGEELRDIQEGLRRSKNRDSFSLISHHAVRTRDLSRALLDNSPNIIHFSGHGVPLQKTETGEGYRSFDWEGKNKDPEMDFSRYSGGIALEDQAGNTVIVKADSLAGMFELFADNIECVVLNSCYSSLQAAAIVKHVPYVIGMKTAVPDETAISFAVSFYDALGAGRDIEFAFNYAVRSGALENVTGSDIPVLHKRG